MKKVQSCFSCIDPIAHRLKLGGRIRDINEKLKNINQEATNLGLQTVIANAQPRVSEIPETDSFSADPVYGRDYEVSLIVEKLTTATRSPAEQVLSVLPIVGMGGLGKTTLARKVFNHEQIISHFGDNRGWVHVPRNFDARNILKNIITSLTNEQVELDETREAILKKLQQHLRTGRYLLVLDDIWDEERDKWDGFVNSLWGISSANGNSMIVTTRSQEVASIVRTLPIHELGCLSRDDCWSIIKAKAFIDSGDVPVEFQTVGRNIAVRCQGSPLAAKVVGGLLLDKSKDEWQDIEMNWLSNFGDDQNTISKILKLSFDHLSSPSLKKCFAYCSIFPKAHRIVMKQLIELWMAEGFVQTETTANKVFNLLLRNSLLQVADTDNYGNVTHCNMHDLVHDLASSVLCENGLLQSRYIGYKSSGDGFLSIPKGQEKYVRTLFFSGKISDIRFSDFESLHSLTLVGEKDIDELPTSIRELKHLRYLDISKTRIRYLSDSIGELYHLQTLRAEFNYHLKKLPYSLSCLINLRHLHIHRSTSLPPGIGKLTSLRTLPYIHVRGEKGCGISELGNLKDLKGELEICNLERVCDKNESMSADLLGKGGIHELRLVWGGAREGAETNDDSVLEGLKPHPNIKRLEICGFKGKRLPVLEGLNYLVEIILEKCSECEELPMLGHVPHLKSLYLIGLTNVKSIGSSFYGNIDNCRRDTIVVVFPALEMLWLEDMPNLKEWDEVDFPSPFQVFPHLKYLLVRECKHLMRAPSHFPCLEELEIDCMEGSLALENIGIKLTSLKKLLICEIEGLECLPDWVFSNNCNLTELKISYFSKMTHLVPYLKGGETPSLLRELGIFHCSSLRELPDDLHSLNSLETLSINGCPNLKSIPYPVSSGGGQQEQGFTSLCNLSIRDCGLTNLPIGMVESCAKSLEMLRLERLSSITNLGMVIMCLHRMSRRLRYLSIAEVPRFSSKDIIGPLHSLQELSIGPFSDSSWNNVSFNETVGAMLLQSIGSLRYLTLEGKEDWDSLPDQLQHLTSLENLELNDFGIEALPEWFGNLSSLKELTLWNCKKFMHLPSKQAMQRPSKLTYLEFWRCPLLLKEEGRNTCWPLLLKENNRSNNNNNPQIVDSEWPNISHIPTIFVNGDRIPSGGDGH